MRDLLRGSLARSLRSLSEEDRLAAALPVVCGTALASHCEVDRLDEERTLHLRVRGREWIGPLLSMREVLRSDLVRAAGVAVEGLHFEAVRIGAVTGADPRKPHSKIKSEAAATEAAPGAFRAQTPRSRRIG